MLYLCSVALFSLSFFSCIWYKYRFCWAKWVLICTHRLELYETLTLSLHPGGRGLKQKRRRRTAKKNSLKFTHLIRQILAYFLELNATRLYQSSWQEKESCCLVFPSLTKRGISKFHVVVSNQLLLSTPKFKLKTYGGRSFTTSCNDGWEMYKKAWRTCKVVVLAI